MIFLLTFLLLIAVGLLFAVMHVAKHGHVTSDMDAQMREAEYEHRVTVYGGANQ